MKRCQINFLDLVWNRMEHNRYVKTLLLTGKQTWGFRFWTGFRPGSTWTIYNPLYVRLRASSHLILTVGFYWNSGGGIYEIGSFGCWKLTSSRVTVKCNTLSDYQDKKVINCTMTFHSCTMLSGVLLTYIYLCNGHNCLSHVFTTHYTTEAWKNYSSVKWYFTLLTYSIALPFLRKIKIHVIFFFHGYGCINWKHLQCNITFT